MRPTIRTALTISRPQNCERDAPESVGTLFYLWELTAVRQAIETAWISGSVRRTFLGVRASASTAHELPSVTEAHDQVAQLMGLVGVPGVATANVSSWEAFHSAVGLGQPTFDVAELMARR
jgi:hypothetical protein